MAWIFVLAVVVFIHELGHFLVARWCGVGVATFSIGFGRELVGFTDKYGTRWKLGWLPLGGYVKFMDDENGASMPARDRIAAMTPEQRAVSFHAKPVWQRTAVVAAGPAANFLSAILMFAGAVYVSGIVVHPPVVRVKPLNPAVTAGLQTGDIVERIDGKPVTKFVELAKAIAEAPGKALALDVRRKGELVHISLTPSPHTVRTRKGEQTRGEAFVEPLEGGGSQLALKVAPHYAAIQAGLETGDLVRTVDGQPIKEFMELSRLIALAGGREMVLGVERAGRTLDVRVTPQILVVPDGFGGTERRGIIGVESGADPAASPVTYPSVLASLRYGVEQTWNVTYGTLSYVADVFHSRQSADKIGGIATVIDVSNQVATFGFWPLVQFVALLSVSIGLINLFPIPLLDGGHLMYYAFEAVRGRPLSEETQEFGFRIGLAVVSMLFVLALWNDRLRIMRFFDWLASFAS